MAHATSASVDNIITLQDLAWDQYTLQVTYDLQLDDNATTTLNLRGAHPMQMQDGELVPLDRDTGTLVVHSVDSIKLGKETTMGLNRTDHAELEEHVSHEMLGDSSACAGILNREGTGRIKHLEIRQLWLQEKTARGHLTFNKIPRAVNLSDALTHHWSAEAAGHYEAMGLLKVGVENGRSE